MFDRIDSLVEAPNLGQYRIKARVEPLFQLLEQFFNVALIEPRGSEDREYQRHNGDGSRDDRDVSTHIPGSLTEARLFANDDEA